MEVKFGDINKTNVYDQKTRKEMAYFLLINMLEIGKPSNCHTQNPLSL